MPERARCLSARAAHDCHGVHQPPLGPLSIEITAERVTAEVWGGRGSQRKSAVTGVVIVVRNMRRAVFLTRQCDYYARVAVERVVVTRIESVAFVYYAHKVLCYVWHLAYTHRNLYARRNEWM